LADVGRFAHDGEPGRGGGGGGGGGGGPDSAWLEKRRKEREDAAKKKNSGIYASSDDEEYTEKARELELRKLLETRARDRGEMDKEKKVGRAGRGSQGLSKRTLLTDG
jgi:hypothetical protein